MAGDNFAVRVASEGRPDFEAAVRLAWGNACGGKATHYLSGIPERRCSECYGQGSYWGKLRDDTMQGSQDKPGYADVDCPKCQGTGRLPATRGIVLFWSKDRIEEEEAKLLPFNLSVDSGINFLWDWLQTAEYPEEPNQDGFNREGFIVTTGDFWGHVEGSHTAFIGVYPDWQMHGK